MEVVGSSHGPDSHCGSTGYAAEDTIPGHTWEGHYLPKFAKGCPIGLGDLPGVPGWVRTTQSPRRFWKPDLLKCIVLEWNTHHWKREDGGGPGLWYLLPSPSPHTCQCCRSSHMYGMHNQVKFLKLPTFVFSRAGGHVLFSTGMFI